MDLRLHWDCGAVRKTKDIDAVVRSKEWIDAVSEASGCLVGVESSGQVVLILGFEHAWLAFEDKKLVFVQSGMDDLEVGIREIVQVDSVDSGTKVDITL